ncbi:hypothetical protein KIL84_006411 [Mauremys mutica]|uniref:Uncharacterized protein n=1 Tax=Mauremys mutica TaxID=74926 RepID=A0A9D3X1E6_9SAUR|nr:hypothetical protein KIL84_006411 [Mauremys mutica]
MAAGSRAEPSPLRSHPSGRAGRGAERTAPESARSRTNPAERAGRPKAAGLKGKWRAPLRPHSARE